MHHVVDGREPEPLERGVRGSRIASGSPRREPEVLADREVVVAERLVADEREIAASAPPVTGEVVVEDDAFARIQRDQPRQQAEQRGLPGAIGAREQHDLARGSVEVDPGQRREATQEANGGAETDDRHTRLRAIDGLECTDGRPARSNRIASPDPIAASLPDCALRYPPTMRSVLGATGRVLVTGGLLVLLFVAYQLWGTGILQSRAQSDLRSEFESTLRGDASATEPSSTSTPGPGSSVPGSSTPASAGLRAPPAPPPDIPPQGEPVALIDIPEIGVSQVVVEGVDVADLRKGPGHYPGTPLPGQEGNAAIAGHRTTYGAPFADLDQLVSWATRSWCAPCRARSRTRCRRSRSR